MTLPSIFIAVYVVIVYLRRHIQPTCMLYFCFPFNHRQNKKVQVGKDQEKAKSEKDSHTKNRGGKKQTNNQVLIQ